MTPKATEIIIPVIGTINRVAFWILSIVIAGISFIIVIIYIILLFYWNNKPIIRAMSWRLTILMCIGCLIAYITAFIYGIDEYYVDKNQSKTWEFLCNFRLCLFQISITLGFTPLFAKTYRISRIFNLRSLSAYVIKDKQLFLVIFLLLIIDIVLLSILIAVGRLHREYKISTMDIEVNNQYMISQNIDNYNDPLYIGQLQFGSCEHINNNGLHFLIIISIIKCLMFIYGLYLAITIIRVPGKKFNDSFEIIISVIFSASLMLICAPLQIFVPFTTLFGINFRYGTMAGSIIIATSLGIAALVLPRFIAICRKKEKQYTKSDVEKERQLKDKFRKELTKQLLQAQNSRQRLSLLKSQTSITAITNTSFIQQAQQSNDVNDTTTTIASDNYPTIASNDASAGDSMTQTQTLTQTATITTKESKGDTDNDDIITQGGGEGDQIKKKKVTKFERKRSYENNNNNSNKKNEIIMTIPTPTPTIKIQPQLTATAVITHNSMTATSTLYSSTNTFSNTTSDDSSTATHLELVPHHMSPISEHAELEHTTNSEFTFKKDRGHYIDHDVNDYDIDNDINDKSQRYQKKKKRKFKKNYNNYNKIDTNNIEEEDENALKLGKDTETDILQHLNDDKVEQDMKFGIIEDDDNDDNMNGNNNGKQHKYKILKYKELYNEDYYNEDLSFSNSVENGSGGNGSGGPSSIVSHKL